MTQGKDGSAADAITQASSNLVVRAMRDPEHLVEMALTFELAARTLRLGIESNIKSPGQKERLQKLSATLDSFFSDVRGDVEQQIGEYVSRQAKRALEAEEGLRTIDTEVEGSDDANPDAWATGFTDARKHAVDSLRFRFDLPGEIRSWDDAISALSRRIKDPSQ